MADNVPATRDAGGKFLPGVSGNPAGKAPGKRAAIVEVAQELELALRQHVKPARIIRIIDKLVRKAENGNIAAAKLILDKVLPNARDTEESDNGPARILISIENATFKAHQAQQVEPAIQGQFEEVKT